MGQKIHPTGFRIGLHETWRSRWYAPKKEYGKLLLEDVAIRKHVKKEYHSAGIPKIEIERTGEAVNVIVHTARPGVLVGRKGVRVDKLKESLEAIAGKTCHLHIREVKRPELDSTLVAEAIAEQLEKRAAFRRAMKKGMQSTLQAGAKGIKIVCSGRLGGAEMSRVEKMHEGRIPLNTLRANIDYGTATARTTYGAIGIKVWIYKGDVFKSDEKKTLVIGKEEVSDGSNA